MAIPSKNELFDPALVADLINKVKGHSSLAKLSAASPVAFNGNKEFTFSMDNEVDIVAENGAKSHGGITIAPVTIVPLKMEYGARVSDEFMYATEEEQIDILKNFNEGFAKKLARGIDIAAFNGFNPRSGAASTVVGDNCFFKKIENAVDVADSVYDAVSDAIGELEDVDVNGLALANSARAALAKEKKTDGNAYFPELAWGGKPDTLNGLAFDANDTLKAVDENKKTLVGVTGDFSSYKWGIAKEIGLEVIPYGDPDNSGVDLKGHNQVYLRAEAYVGWAILDADAFCLIKQGE